MRLKSLFSLGCLPAALLLSGCASQITHPQNLQVTPLDAAALGIKNLVSFDLYGDGPAVHAAFVATPQDGKQTIIGYLHSEDGGLHWSAPRLLSSQFDQTVESKAGNDIQVAVAGDQRMVIWQARGELPGMGPLFPVYSLDAGETWQQGTNPVGSEGDQSHHDIIADAEGRFHVVWLDDRDENGYQGVRYARSGDAGQHWESAQTIDDSSCSCCWNRLALGKDGELNVLYRDMEFRDMALAQSADAGMNWQRLGAVAAFNWKFDGCPHNGGGLSYAGDGSLHSVVWTGAENKIGLYHIQSADGGKTWTEPQIIAGNGFHADIASHGDRLAMVWDARGPEGSEVFFSESADNGAHWSAARRLSAATGTAEFPRIVATANGLLAMWLEKRPGAGKQLAAAVLQWFF